MSITNWIKGRIFMPAMLHHPLATWREGAGMRHLIKHWGIPSMEYKRLRPRTWIWWQAVEQA